MSNCETKETFNRKAYDDVLSVLPPQEENNETYMEYYRFWSSVAGEKHFDPYYDVSDRD